MTTSKSGTRYGSIPLTLRGTVSRMSAGSSIILFLFLATTNLGALQLAWRYPTGGRIRSEPAVGPRGSVYALSDDGYLYSFAADGKTQWAANLHGLPTDCLAIGEDGTAYAGMLDGRLMAVNPAGSVIWSFNAQGAIVGNPAIARDGTLFVGTEQGTLYTLSLGGSVEWSITLPAKLTAAPILDGQETLYLGGSDRRLYALTRWGRFKWSLPLEGVAVSLASGSNGSLYALLSGGDLVAVSAEGSIEWRRSVGSRAFGPLLDSERSFVGDRDGQIEALSLRGKILWRRSVKGGLVGSWVLGSEELYIMGTDRQVTVLAAATGKVISSFHVDAIGSMNLSSDGTLLVGGRDWLVYAYRGARAEAHGVWTALSGNERNSGHGIAGARDTSALRLLNRIPDYLALATLADLRSRYALGGVLRELAARIESGKTGKSTWYVRRLLERVVGVGTLNPIVEGATVVNDFPDVRARAAVLLGALPSLGARGTLIRALLAETDPVAAASEMGALGRIASDGDGAATRAIASTLSRLEAVAGMPLPGLARAAVAALAGIAHYEGEIPDVAGRVMLISVFRGSYPREVRGSALALLENHSP